jgi:hypothetical protein
MNAPRYWQRPNERFALLETTQKMPSGPLRPVQLHHGAMNFFPAIGGGAESLKGSRRMGAGRSDFSINLYASLFHKGLSNEPSFRADPSRCMDSTFTLSFSRM